MAGMRGTVGDGHTTSGLDQALQEHQGGGVHASAPGDGPPTPSIQDARATQRRILTGSANNAVAPGSSYSAGMSAARKLGDAFNAFNPVSNLSKAAKALKGQ
jgi:hypothetical protein